MTRATLFVLLALSLLSGCSHYGHSVVLRDTRFTVEIADDPGEQQLGLMFRDVMPDEQGMLFIFQREEPRSFWMKNTRITLDILYFDSAQILVSMHQNVPPCRTPQCPGYPSNKPARYVLELNGGIASRLGVSLGDHLEVDL